MEAIGRVKKLRISSTVGTLMINSPTNGGWFRMDNYHNITKPWKNLKPGVPQCKCRHRWLDNM